MKYRILVVDDDPGIRSLLTRGLERWECEVVAVASSEAAYAEIGRTSFDAILLDVRIPGVSGAALYHAVTNRWPDLMRKIVIMTGDPKADELGAWLEEQPCPILTKPFDMMQLRKLLDRVLHEPRRDVGNS